MRHRSVVAVGLALACVGCTGPTAEQSAADAATHSVISPTTSLPPSPAILHRPPRATGPTVSDGRPRRALLTVPKLGIVDLPVVPYRGWTDDAPGTAIQNRGLAASPFGARGGVGPGGIGNYQVTAHRLSSTRAFEFLPRLGRDDRVLIDVGRTRYVYAIVQTRSTSFRSPASLRAQRAAVPGRPGVEPTKAMLTLSTCATVEDHAAGNYWADEFDNPEHRIDKIGVLVATRRLSR